MAGETLRDKTGETMGVQDSMGESMLAETVQIATGRSPAALVLCYT